MSLSKEKSLEVADFYSRNGEAETLKEYNLQSETLRRYLRYARNYGSGIDSRITPELPNPHKNSFDEKDDGTASCVANRAHTRYSIEEIALLFKVDTEIWKVKRHITNSWDVTNKDGVRYTNFQSKVWWEKDLEAEKLLHIKDTIFADLKENAPEPKPLKRHRVVTADNLLEINIRDLHLGKLVWGTETDGVNYDIKIAQERALSTLDDLLAKGAAFGFEKIVIVGSDDFFNTDTIEGTTTRGTRQDDDVRWKKMFHLGKHLWYAMIERMREYAPVHVVMISGNHDLQRSYFLGEVLEAMFCNYEDVYIDNGEKCRKYFEYGKVLIGFTHGSDVKVQNLPMLMAQEAPEMWGRTKFREVHIGHLHKRKEIKWVATDEQVGVVVRHMRSLSGTDVWHHEKGFVGSVKGAEAFVWNKETGMNAMFESNLTF